MAEEPPIKTSMTPKEMAKVLRDRPPLSAAELKSFQHAERSRPCALRIATMDKNGKWTKERVVP